MLLPKKVSAKLTKQINYMYSGIHFQDIPTICSLNTMHSLNDIPETLNSVGTCNILFLHINVVLMLRWMLKSCLFLFSEHKCVQNHRRF